MQFAAGGLGTLSLGSILQDPGASNDEALSPIIVEIDGLDMRAYMEMNSLTIDDTQGQPVTANFTMVHLAPELGARVRITYFSEVIFAGTIDHIDYRTDDLVKKQYVCDCLDWSQSLLRRRLQRNFTNDTVQGIVDSILDNEMAGEGLTIGRIDTLATIPICDSDGGKIFDALRTLAGMTGQTFYVDYDRAIQMRSVNLPVAPLVMNEANTLVANSSLKTDRETYRNRQIVVVTGTPAEGTDALTVSVMRENADQIAARQAIEGGTGVYEDIIEITHPTSNDGVTITLLAISYAVLSLAISGSLRATLSCSARGYGFRAGQIATVDLPTFGIAGTFAIQRVAIREVAGRYLFHDLEFVNSSSQQRAYEAWMSIVRGGKVVVQRPSLLTNNLQTYDTPGSYTFTVPAGVTTVEVTVLGASGGGSGGARYTGLQNGNPPHDCGGGGLLTQSEIGTYGGNGGASGKAVTILSVLEGEELTIEIGTAGLAGASDSNVYGTVPGPIPSTESTTATAGTEGTASSVTHRGSVVCQGDGGHIGTAGRVSVTKYAQVHFNPDQKLCLFPGANALNNAGAIGDAISIGGGKPGGARGTGVPYAQPAAGFDGLVEVRW